jgi:hypothetical protein
MMAQTRSRLPSRHPELRDFVERAAHGTAEGRSVGRQEPATKDGVNIPVRSEIGRNIDFVTNAGFSWQLLGLEEWI